MSGVGTSFDGYNTNVRSRVEKQSESSRSNTRNKTETEILGDVYLAHYKAREAQEAAEAKAKADVLRETRLREQADADRKRRQAVYRMNEALFLHVFDKYSLTIAERNQVETELDGTMNPERAEILAQQIVLERTA